VDHYYRFLDLGYRLTALAGSDFPWCGRGGRPGEEIVGPRIGNARFYAQVARPFSFDAWYDAVKAGRTFVTTGPMLELEVNGRMPGASLDLQPGAKLRIKATAHGHASDIPLQRLQVVVHGKILAEAQADQPGQASTRLSLEHEMDVEHGIWIAARTDAGTSQVAHTTPVYVTVNGDGFHNRENLASQIEVSKRYLQEIRDLLKPGIAPPIGRKAPGPASYPAASRARLEQRITEAEAILDDLRRRR
jgi:hypothetical protein